MDDVSCIFRFLIRLPRVKSESRTAFRSGHEHNELSARFLPAASIECTSEEYEHGVIATT